MRIGKLHQAIERKTGWIFGVHRHRHQVPGDYRWIIRLGDGTQLVTFEAGCPWFQFYASRQERVTVKDIWKELSK